MKVMPTKFRDAFVVVPDVFDDKRGSFCEVYNKQRFQELTGFASEMVQDNHSVSIRGVLRGLHYQLYRPQAKLVRVTSGEVFDVIVDLRQSSPTFGEWDGIVLSSVNRKQIFIPEGFAHGFFVMSDLAEVVYKTSDYYSPQDERSIAWNDKDLSIDWPVRDERPLLSQKDADATAFKGADYFT